MTRGTVFVMTVVMLFGSFATARGQDEHAPREGVRRGEIRGGEMAMEEDFEPPRRQESYLAWLVRSLGWRYTLFLPLAAMLSCVLTGVLLLAGKGKSTEAAIAFVVAIPFLIGVFGMFDGLMSSFIVISQSATSPKPSEVAEGISTSIVTPLVGMFLMGPCYLLATIGLFIRSLKGDSKP